MCVLTHHVIAARAQERGLEPVRARRAPNRGRGSANPARAAAAVRRAQSRVGSRTRPGQAPYGEDAHLSSPRASDEAHKRVPSTAPSWGGGGGGWPLATAHLLPQTWNVRAAPTALPRCEPRARQLGAAAAAALGGAGAGGPGAGAAQRKRRRQPAAVHDPARGQDDHARLARGEGGGLRRADRNL